MPAGTFLAIWSGALCVGVLGGALGVGGGLFLVPLLVFLAELRPIEAVGVSLFCVIGTSAGASSVALKTGEANMGLGLTLEPGLILGAVLSSLVAQRITDDALLLAFAAMVFVIGVSFLLRRGSASPLAGGDAPPPRFFDGSSSGVPYRVRHAPLVFALTPLAGVASGLFGIGGGMVTVPLVGLVGGVPIKATASTTSLSLMVSAAAAGAVHLAHGTVPPHVVAASLAGVIPGGLLGARLQMRLPERALRVTFAVMAIGVAVSMVRKALQ